MAPQEHYHEPLLTPYETLFFRRVGIPQVDSRESREYADLNPTLGGREALSYRLSAQGRNHGKIL